MEQNLTSSLHKYSLGTVVLIGAALLASSVLPASAFADTSISNGWKALDQNGKEVSLIGDTYLYSGNKVAPIASITDGSHTLKEGDYIVKYFHNYYDVQQGAIQNPSTGAALVCAVSSKGYTGSFPVLFKMSKASFADSTDSISFNAFKKNIASASIEEIPTQKLTEKGSAVKPTPKITLSGNVLNPDTDYTLTYKENTAPGTATLIANGQGDYTGVLMETFTIDKMDIAKAKISNIADQKYKKKAIKPTPTITFNGVKLKNKTDYTLSYKANNKLGTATVSIKGKGQYKGSKTIKFKIVGMLTKSSVESPGSYNYTGKAVKATPKVTFNGKTLKKGRDYTLTYKNNIKTGTASVIVTGKGNYKGRVSKNFTIIKMTAGEYLARCAGAICYSKPVWGGYNNSYNPNTNRAVWKKVHDGVRKGQNAWYHSCTVNLMTTVRWSGYDNARAIRQHLSPAMDSYLKNTPKKWKYLSEHRFRNASEANKILQPGDILWHGNTGNGHTLMYIGPTMAKTIYNEYIKGTDGDKGAPPSDYVWISAHGGYKGTCQPAICGSDSLAYYNHQAYKVARPVGSLSKLDKTFKNVMPNLRPSVK